MNHTFFARWNEAMARLVRQPNIAGGGVISLAPPVRQSARRQAVANRLVLGDHLEREFARIREEERNILDQLIMLD